MPGQAAVACGRALRALPHVGPTRASKLYARKRPRLRPVFDTVVERVIGQNRLWEPLRAQLQADPGLHPRPERLRRHAQLPAAVSELRVFDVLAWTEGTYGHTCPRPTEMMPIAEAWGVVANTVGPRP